MYLQNLFKVSNSLCKEAKKLYLLLFLEDVSKNAQILSILSTREKIMNREKICHFSGILD
jgi:hypothetical protein